MSGFKPGNDDGKETRFKPGQSGNPGGKPVGARNRITVAFLAALADDFDKHGAKAIARCRTEHPDAYVRACIALIPKELELPDGGLIVVQVAPIDRQL